ncbi:MAG: DUF1697 domain-containing protein [Oscillospiraceae bacterium]
MAMTELKLSFVKLGYDDALTYLNSGNVVFSAIEEEKNVLADKIKSMIQGQFCLDIPVFVILQEKTEDALGQP